MDARTNVAKSQVTKVKKMAIELPAEFRFGLDAWRTIVLLRSRDGASPVAT